MFWLLFLIASSFAPLPLSAQTHVTASAGRVVGEWWYEPGNPGWGLVLTHSDTRTVVQHVDFDDDGEGYWQVGAGPRAAAAFSATLLRTHWIPSIGLIGSPRVNGQVDMTRVDDLHADVVLRVGDNTRRVRMERIVVAADPVIRDGTGLWLNPDRQGIGLTLLSQGPVLAVLVLAYDTNGEPRWWLAHGAHGLSGQKLPASRYRRSCAAPCAVESIPSGDVTVTWKDERNLQVQWALGDHVGSGAPPAFTENARYALITEPASGRRYPAEARPFTNRAAIDAYQRSLRGPMTCSTGAEGLWARNGLHETRVLRNPNDAPTPWTYADSLVDVGPFVVSVAESVWPNLPSRIPASIHRLDGERGTVQSVATLQGPDTAPLVSRVLPLAPEGSVQRFVVISDNGWSRCRNVGMPSSAMTFVRLSSDGTPSIERVVQLDVSVDALMRHGDRLIVLGNTPLVEHDVIAGASRPSNPVLRLAPNIEVALRDTPVHIGRSGEFDRTLMTAIELSDSDVDAYVLRNLVLDGAHWVPGADDLTLVAETFPRLYAGSVIEIQSWSLADSNTQPAGGEIPALFDPDTISATRFHHDGSGLRVVVDANRGAGHAAELWTISRATGHPELQVRLKQVIGPGIIDGAFVRAARVSHIDARTFVTWRLAGATSESGMVIVDRVTGLATDGRPDQFIGRVIPVSGRIALSLQGADARTLEMAPSGQFRVGFTSVIGSSIGPAILIAEAVSTRTANGETTVVMPSMSYGVSGPGGGSSPNLMSVVTIVQGAQGAPPLVSMTHVAGAFDMHGESDPFGSDAVQLRQATYARLVDDARVRIEGRWMFLFAGSEVFPVAMNQ